MKTVIAAFGETVAVLFPIVDPIGNTPTFLALTARYEQEARLKLIVRVVLFVVIALCVFALIGEPLLQFFGISLEALQIAGGLIIGYTGFKMIVSSEEFMDTTATGDVAFAPLTIPLLAGPGAMAALLGLESREADVALSLPGTLVGIAVIGAIIFLCFRFGERLARFLGPAGLVGLNVVMGLIVLAIGVEMVVHGIVDHGAVVKIR